MNRRDLSIRPGVGAIVVDEEGRVLLHRRKADGGWAPPSGAVEPGEALESALHREIREETSLAVEVEHLVGVYSDPRWQIVQHPDRGPVHFVTSVFACRRSAGRLRGSNEGTAWKWFDPSSFPDELLDYAREWLTDACGEGPFPVVR